MLSIGIQMLRHGIERARAAAKDEQGASALEWALIAAVVVVAASIIGGAIYRIVQSKSASLEDCAGAAPGTQCGPGQ